METGRLLDGWVVRIAEPFEKDEKKVGWVSRLPKPFEKDGKVNE